MGFRINTNVSSIAAQRALNTTNRMSQNTLAKMSSGTRITRAADDAGGGDAGDADAPADV